MFKRFKKAAAAICAASMVLSMTACGSAGDKKVELHFTHTQSPGSISDLTAQEFKRLVEERSGGTTITDLTDEQKAEFQKACAGIYDDYARSVGQDVIDLFTGGYKE